MCYNNSRRYGAFLKYYNEALTLLKDGPEKITLQELFILGIVEVYMKKDELDKAKEYLDKAVKIADKSEYLQLKKKFIKELRNITAKYRILRTFCKINDKKRCLEG